MPIDTHVVDGLHADASEPIGHAQDRKSEHAELMALNVSLHDPWRHGAQAAGSPLPEGQFVNV